MKRYAMLPLFSLAMVGCGGGSESSNGETTSPTTPSAVEGRIERVSGNTIYVNGYEYQVSAVSYLDGSAPASFLAGKENMMVRIANSYARHGGGVNVELEPTFTGQIIFAPGSHDKPNRFLVNGVELEFATLSSNIQDGDWVMVSALPTANAGYKVLSVIEFNNEFGHLAEAEGRINNLNINAGSFKIGQSLTVLFDKNNVDFALREGLWVEVVGSFNETNSTLTAETITREDYSHITHDGEIEGIVTWVAKDKRAFELNYRAQIKVNGATEFDDGNKADLKPGAWVEVELRNNQNKLIAEEIEFEGRDDNHGDWDKLEFEFEGYVADYNVAEQSFSINGKTIHTDAHTEFENGANFDTIFNEFIEVEGMWIDGKRIARSIEIEDEND
ncbi:DUF5666 domain-containing protein [Photobacterium nomapromontoriensis]|uniref:DUF5666 domain-containing protein n=1 Tax=Photobacterium nomapromontoriensis TaxID=2910237 RepID=UPI003D14C60C